MGKTPVPLVIWIDDDFVDHPKVAELRDKGHTVYRLGDLWEAGGPGTGRPDLILSRVAWMWDDGMWNYLDTALKAARLRKKEAA